MSKELTFTEAVNIREKWFNNADVRYEIVTGRTEHYRVQCLQDYSKDYDEIEVELKNVKIVLAKFARASEKISKEKYIIQPFLDIYKLHGILICEIRKNN